MPIHQFVNERESFDGPLEVDVVVEIPRGSRNKYEVDDEGHVHLNRRVYGPVAFPTDYGYVPGTRGSDDDALDAVVLLNEEDKILGAAVSDPSYDDVMELDDLPDSARDETGAFFEMYRRLEKGGNPELARSLGAQETRDLYTRDRDRYLRESAAAAPPG